MSIPALWYLLDANGEPVPEEDESKVLAFLRGDRFANGRCVAETRVGSGQVLTSLLPAAGPEYWETLVADCSDESKGAPYLFKCGGPRANALDQHALHVAKARAWMVAQPPPYNEAHPLVAEWMREVFARRDEAMGTGLIGWHGWHALTLGWALATGLNVEQANAFALETPL